MSQRITVEGTITPSTFLAAGARRTVTRTAFVEKLIGKGFIRVVDDETTTVESQPVAEEEIATEVPARNAKREVWAAFLERLDPDIHFTDEDGRDDLIALYESRG
ncbi:hypothetical protein MYP14_05985 [Rhodococcus pyridinivorans]|uniref:hypothetical protein n=1 Tax=Rhodococcus pyridinivorans TaxID=103816 RepID=UPI0020002B9E|nr:hypothetical protein [Rhodococcus pyridinivorans]UPK64899.1 hypothetical protein MYP14_05985 [Rhodococcus pyridinivorans]